MERTEPRLAEALRRAHVALLEDLRKLEEIVRPEAGRSVAELAARLGATYAHITEHFRFEEQDGYMEAVRQREPRLERDVEQLAGEHCRLAESLAALLAEARGRTAPDSSFPGRVRAWVAQVRRHEARENDLVQEAFNWDVAAED
jgi:DNA-binding transcriptional ArsR family regulator